MKVSHFVLDCSVVFYWFFDKEPAKYYQYAKEVQHSFESAKAIVPPLWQTEVMNVLVTAQKSSKINLSESLSFLNLLKSLPIEIMPVKQDSEVIHLSMEFDLTAYDATYLALALQNNIPIASLDQKLLKAAKKAGVALHLL